MKRWLLDHLPGGLLSRPDEWLVAALCVLSGIASLAGQAASDSVDQLLPGPLLRAWGACLLIGAVCLYVGLFTIKRVPNGYMIRHVATYLLGQRLLMWGSLIYAIAVLAVTHLHGSAIGAGLALMFSLSRLVRILTTTDGGDRE